MVDYNRISQTTLDFLDYAKNKTPDIVFITLINPAEEKVSVYAQIVTTSIIRTSNFYTFEEFLDTSFESIHKSLILKLGKG